MRGRRLALVFVGLAIAGLLYFLSGFPYLASSTLNGGTVVGDSVAVREVPKNSLSVESGITKLSEYSLAFSLSSSGGDDCKPRFTKVELDGDALILTKGKVGICTTMQIDSYYFIVTSLRPLPNTTAVYVNYEDSQKAPQRLLGD